MRLTSAQLDTVILKCRNCRQRKKALWFRLLAQPENTYEVETICTDCLYRKPKTAQQKVQPVPEPKKAIEPWTAIKICPMHRMYKGGRDSGESRWCEHAVKWRYKKYVKRHNQVNEEFSHLAKKNLDIDDPADTIKCIAEIEKYRSKHDG